METTPHRGVTEAWELVAHAVDLRRRGVPHVTLLAALDQARRSLHHEPCRDARRTLTWIVGALEHGDARRRASTPRCGSPPTPWPGPRREMTRDDHPDHGRRPDGAARRRRHVTARSLGAQRAAVAVGARARPPRPPHRPGTSPALHRRAGPRRAPGLWVRPAPPPVVTRRSRLARRGASPARGPRGTTAGPGTDPPGRGRRRWDAHRQAAAIDRRHTDRRRFSGRSVPPDVLGALADAARPFGGVLHVAFGAHRAWSPRPCGRPRSASPSRRVTPPSCTGGRTATPGPGTASRPPPGSRGRHRPTATWCCGGSHGDAPPAARRDGSRGRVDAGDPHRGRPGARLRPARRGVPSAVLLEATALGLATTPITQVLEVEETRERLRHLIVGAHRPPVVALRIGWPSERGDTLHPTPRRSLDHVLTEVD